MTTLDLFVEPTKAPTQRATRPRPTVRLDACGGAMVPRPMADAPPTAPTRDEMLLSQTEFRAAIKQRTGRTPDGAAWLAWYDADKRRRGLVR